MGQNNTDTFYIQQYIGIHLSYVDSHLSKTVWLVSEGPSNRQVKHNNIKLYYLESLDIEQFVSMEMFLLYSYASNSHLPASLDKVVSLRGNLAFPQRRLCPCLDQYAVKELRSTRVVGGGYTIGTCCRCCCCCCYCCCCCHSCRC